MCAGDSIFWEIAHIAENNPIYKLLCPVSMKLEIELLIRAF